MTTLFATNLDEAQQHAVAGLFADFQHPTLQKNLIELKAVKKVEKGGDTLRVEITMPFAWNTAFEQLKNALTESLKQATNSQEVRWVLNYQIATLKRANNHPAVKGVKNIIAITSFYFI